VTKRERAWKVWVEPNGDGWRTRWYDHSGAHGELPFIYKDDAEDACKRKKRNFQRVDAGLPPLVEAGEVTLWALVQKRLTYCRRELDAATVERFDSPACNQLVEFFGPQVPIAGITIENLEDWLDWLREDKGYSETTVAMRYAHAAPIFAMAKARAYIEVNPFDVVEKPTPRKVARLLTEAEIDIMLGLLPPILKRAVVLALCSGLRKEEEQILDWQKHGRELDKPIWAFELQAHETKNGKPKIVPVGPRLQAVLGQPGRGLVVPGLSDSMIQYWFAGKNGGQAPAHTNERAVFRAIGRVRWHDFKHYFCTNYLRDTGDVYGCSAITGNTIKSLEENYKHWLRPRVERITQVSFPFLESLSSPEKAQGAEAGDVQI
jgi:integrase